MEALQADSAVAEGTQAGHRLVARPTPCARVFDQQIAPGLLQLLCDHCAMRLLQIVGRRFQMPEKAGGGLDVIAVQEHLRKALSGLGRPRCDASDGTLIPAGIMQLHFAEVLLRPLGWGVLMNGYHVQEGRSSSFLWGAKFQPEFRA